MKEMDTLAYLLYEMIHEIKLSVDNAVEIKNNQFKVGDIEYEIYYNVIDIDGKKIPDIGFNQKGNEVPNVRLSNTKPGEVIKVYSTMYKAILDYINKNQPDYLVVSSFEHSGYFSIYSQLVKDNPIDNYFVANSMLKTKNKKGQVLNSILLKRYNKTN